MASIPSDGFARETDGTTAPVHTAWMAEPEPDGCTPGPGQPCHDEPSGQTGADVEADGGGTTTGWGQPGHH